MSEIILIGVILFLLVWLSIAVSERKQAWEAVKEARESEGRAWQAVADAQRPEGADE